ncbi:hypothetical protein JVU11DRAFT_6804 [Chiua virens]|nr:hypothetical protein JVU11DRAFT_6804 [Chiua virens]
MAPRRSLDDTCDIFLSRHSRIRAPSPLASQWATSEFPHYAPALRPENIQIPPLFLLPRHLEPLPELPPAPLTHRDPATKPLPVPGSSGFLQQKPSRGPDGSRHVPRPRNPFILFRCDLVHQRKTLPRSDLDDTNISRIAGDLWRVMTAGQKQPWVDLAAKEKARHALLYPDYKYAPTHGGSKGKKVRGDNALLEGRPARQIALMGSPPDHSKSRRHVERTQPYPQPIPRRRSSSCPPPGAVPINIPPPRYLPTHEWSQAPTRVTQDDMQRRPSSTIMYQSVASQSIVEPAITTAPIVPSDPGVSTAQTTPALSAFDPVVPLENFDWLNFVPLPPFDPSLLDESTYSSNDLTQNPASYAASNFDFGDVKSVGLFCICSSI